MEQTHSFAPGFDHAYPHTAGFATAMTPLAAKVGRDLMARSAQFMTDQLNATVAFQNDILTNPADLTTRLADYVTQTLEACSLEMTRAATRMAVSICDIKKDVREGHRRTHNDVPV